MSTPEEQIAHKIGTRLQVAEDYGRTLVHAEGNQKGKTRHSKTEKSPQGPPFFRTSFSGRQGMGDHGYLCSSDCGVFFRRGHRSTTGLPETETSLC